MARGLVPFGDRVLVVAHPSDDKTSQRILTVTASGNAEYLRTDGSYRTLATKGTSLSSPAILRGEGVEADYADGLLALLNSDSLSPMTESGFLDWGSGSTPSGSPTSWSTQVPLVIAESHQRTVAVLGAGAGNTLLVAHVGRLYKDNKKTKPVSFPGAMVSTDRGRTWTWGPSIKGAPPSGAYAAAWPNAQGGSQILYFPTLLPGPTMPPLAVFRPDSQERSGADLDVPYATQEEYWGNYGFSFNGHVYAPQPLRHWVTRWGLFLDTGADGLFLIETPTSRPKLIESVNPDRRSPDQVTYFEYNENLVRVTGSGSVEYLRNPSSTDWRQIAHVDRPDGVIWEQAAPGPDRMLWMLGSKDNDVVVATFRGRAF